MAFRCMNPAPTNRIDREMNRLLSTFFGESTQPSISSPSVAVNVWEKGDAWLLEAEMPGVTPENLEISVVNDELTVSVERPETGTEDVNFLRRERARGSFVRTIKLPTSVNADRVEATLVHGVLTLTLPKSEAARRHTIQVNAGN